MLKNQKKRFNPTAVLLLAALLIVPQTVGAPHAAAAVSAGPSDPAEIEKFADSLLNDPAFQNRLQGAGAVFTMVGDGKVLLNKGYGYADIETQTPVDADHTLFPIASVTKTVTTAAILQKVEKGELDLKQDVQAYMNGVTLPNETGVPVTIENLLTHTSGFNYGEGVMNIGDDPELWESLGTYIERSMPTVVREPGTSYRYDNFGFQLLGYILEEIDGQPYEDTLKQNIFEPLGMDNSGFSRDTQTISRMASAYDAQGQPIEIYDKGLSPGLSTSGGMLSTGSDMANFMLAMLGEPGEDGKRFLQSDTLANMQSVQFSMSNELPNSAYGFEYSFRELHNDEAVIGKGGDLPGYHSYLWLLPERGVGGMIMMNTDAYGSQGEVFKAFMDHYYPKPTDTSSSTPSQVAVSSEDLEAYAGIYRNLRNPFRYITVRNENGALELQPSGMMNYRLNPISGRVFSDSNGNKSGFGFDEKGQVSYLYTDYFTDTWYERVPNFKPYTDLQTEDPYTDSIETIRLMGLSTEESAETFGPEQPVTRSEFVGQLAKLSNSQPANSPARFEDARQDPNAGAIELFAEMGGITGYPDGTFRPERPVTREEASLMILRLSSGGADVVSSGSEIEWTEQPSKWAEDAVKFMIEAQLYGPEVKKDSAGAYDYAPSAPLLRQEAAIILVKLAATMG